jgi:predicted nucleic acid-binding protein
MPENPVVVFDSNVLIPLILKASLSTRLFLRLDAAKWEVAVSPRMIAEVEEKLRTKKSLRRWTKLSDNDDRFRRMCFPVTYQGTYPDLQSSSIMNSKHNLLDLIEGE